MSKNQNEFKPKIYHSFILSCLLTTLLIINSNNIKKLRIQNKLNQEKNQLFNNIIFKRYLNEEEDEENSNSGTKDVCKRGSEELNKYYKTGNLKDIELEEGAIECKDKDEDYMKALINILKSYSGGLEMRNLEDIDENDSSSENNSDLKENLITYGKHVIPILVFVVVAILCIPGWLICCFCCCCNCCCCCCCKKPGCKIPCFFISLVMYALVIAVCFYGLSQSNHIFIGLADTECSILKFFDEVLDGESKEVLPKWAGIKDINDILVDLKREVEIMGSNDATDGSVKSKLRGAMNTIDNPTSGTKRYFLNDLHDFSNGLSTDSTCQLEIPDSNTRANGIYMLDLAISFGTFDKGTNRTNPEENCLAYNWLREYKAISEVADQKMLLAYNGFDNILGSKLPDIISALEEGISTIDGLKTSFVDIKDGVANLIIDYSEIIDEYGKLGVKAVFGVLALIDIGIAVFIFLLCFCSGKACVNCCCCRCICKFFTHLLWNILALLMIIVLLVGTIFALVGKIGGDSMSLISYLLSEDNLGEDKETILLEPAKNYVITCVNGDGKIENQLGFDLTNINSLDDIKNAENTITYAKNEFETIETYVYTNLKNELEDRYYFNTNFKFIKEDGGELKFEDLLNEINVYGESNNKKEKWEISCPSEDACNVPLDSHENNICFKPEKCLPSDRNWVNNARSLPEDSDKRFIDTVDIITLMKDKMKEALGLDSSTAENSFKTKLIALGNKYEDFLNSYVAALTEFENQISRITRKLNEYTGDSGLFSFINCKFIGTNMKIILKYLKEALGNDFYTVGVCLILVGCSLALAISSTILLIIIINIDIDKKKEEIKNKEIPEYPINSEGRVIRYRN